MQEVKKKYIVVGYSGHSYVVLETILLLGYEIKGYMEHNIIDKNPYGISYLGKEDKINFSDKNHFFFVTIGNNHKRHQIAEKLRNDGIHTPNLIHPSSSISKNISLGDGNFVARNAAISDLCSFENDIIINTGSIVDHGCIISSGVHLAPGSILCGNVQVGKNSFIGAGSVIKQGVKIGKNVTIGAGSVVLKNVPDSKLIYGNPAKQIDD